MANAATTRLPTIGAVILAWRKYREMTSTELSEKAGVRIAYLSEVEHDRTIHPQEEFLEKLADALNVPLEDILGRRMPLVDGEVGGASNAQQGDEGNKKGASQSTVFHTPVATKQQKILMHRLGVAEKKLASMGKMLNELYEELSEIAALVEDMSSEDTQSEE